MRTGTFPPSPEVSLVPLSLLFVTSESLVSCCCWCLWGHPPGSPGWWVPPAHPGSPRSWVLLLWWDGGGGQWRGLGLWAHRDWVAEVRYVASKGWPESWVLLGLEGPGSWAPPLLFVQFHLCVPVHPSSPVLICGSLQCPGVLDKEPLLSHGCFTCRLKERERESHAVMMQMSLPGLFL